MRFFVLCMLLFGCVLPLFSITEGAEDTNGDGYADKWIETEDKDITVFKFDRDYDSRIDYCVKIDNSGNTVYEELDFNNDGSMDDFYFFSNGVLTHRKVDTNYDGLVDLWVYLEEGIYITRYERDTDFDGTVDITKTFGE